MEESKEPRRKYERMKKRNCINNPQEEKKQRKKITKKVKKWFGTNENLSNPTIRIKKQQKYLHKLEKEERDWHDYRQRKKKKKLNEKYKLY